MKLPLAVLNLLHQKLRTLVAIGGVAFAVILLFMQLGFLASAENSALVLLQNLNYDLILISPQYLDINRSSTFPRQRLYQVLSDPAVARVAPVYVGATLWRTKDRDAQGKGERKRRSIMVVGVDPADRDFLNAAAFAPEGLRLLERIELPAQVLMDRLSRDYFTPRYDPNGSAEAELLFSTVQIVGEFEIGTGFGADGLLLMSDQTFSQIFGGLPLDRISLGLVQLRPGEDPDAACQRVQSLFPEGDVRVRTREKMEAKEKDYWLTKTSVGVIFLLGVGVALIVGVVFVYQVVSSDIANRLGEFATLKAMGYSQGYLKRVVLEQALLLGLLAYVPGLLFSLALYAVAESKANLLIGMTWERAGGVLVLALGMCAVSGLLAIRKLQHADPADRF